MDRTLPQTTIVIPTSGRADLLYETVVSLQAQTHPPQLILISAADADSVLKETCALPRVEVFIAPRRGSSAQRNAALERVSTPYTLFLDDDVELAPNYLASMEALFGERDGLLLAGAEMAADGAHTDTGYSRAAAKQVLSKYAPTGRIESVPSVIGCNLFARTAIAREVGFDERLPLYGYLEDVDFSTRAGRLGPDGRGAGGRGPTSFGPIQQNGRTGLVHLGASSGRVSGVRLGYSQIVNPLYLWRKSGYPNLGRVVVHFWLRLVLSNLVRSVLRTSHSRADRPGRLKGNLLAFGDLLRGRITPERIVTL